MLVTGGFGEYRTEIIDLQSSNSTCESFPGFRYRAFAAGGLLSKEIPIICGGSSENFADKCSSFKDGEWTISHQLSEERYAPAMTSSPYPNNPEGLFILGGDDFFGSATAQFLTKEGVESVLPNFPHKLFRHCLVLLNSSTVMAIGGYQGGTFLSDKTYFFNTNNPVWVEGPLLSTGRGHHSCGRIRTNFRNISDTCFHVLSL